MSLPTDSTSASPHPPAPRTPAPDNHPAWQQDQAKIKELESKVERLIRARRVRARRHRREEAELRRQCDSLVSSFQAIEDAKLRTELAKVEHEAASWKKTYNEQLITRFMGATGISLALEQASKKMEEQDAVIEKLKEELTLGRIGSLSEVTGSDEADAHGPADASITLGVLSESNQGLASAFDMDAFSAPLTETGPSSQATGSGHSPVPPSDETAQSRETISRRLVDKEVEFVRVAHQLAQQTETISSEQAKTRELADLLSTAHAEIEELRGKVKDLTAELQSSQAKIADAETRLWQEKISRPLGLVQDIRQANGRLEKFIQRSTGIFRELLETAGGKLEFSCGIELRAANTWEMTQMRAWHPEGGDVSLSDGFQHLSETCRVSLDEFRERKGRFDALVEEAKEELKRARKLVQGREDEEDAAEIARELDVRGDEDLTEADLFNWDDDRVGELFPVNAQERMGLLELLGD